MDDKKPSTSTTPPPPPTSTPPPASSPTAAMPIKNPLISRRRFLKGAVAASVVLAAASVGASGQNLGPLIPPSSTSMEIIDWTTLDNRNKDVMGKARKFQPKRDSEFFYNRLKYFVRPYDEIVIPKS